MKISAPDARTALVTLSGDCSPADLDELRQALVTAVDGTDPGTDLLVDAHDVTAFDDACIPALVAARSRAKWNRQSFAVVADVGGPVEACLRRSGHLARIPVFADVTTAREVLDRHHAALGRRAGRTTDRGEHDLGIANPFRLVVR